MEYLLRTVLIFRQLLAKLYQEFTIDRNDPLMAQLDIAAKYELIRMKSEGLLTFEKTSILLSEEGRNKEGLLTQLRQVG
ncbi:MAG: hypothetical protein AAGC88_05590 [Bacteroidota bacterium]